MLSTVPPILKLSLLDLRDQGSLAIVDESTYATTPTVFALQITPPGWPTINVTGFVPGSVNIFKCADLGITCPQPECCPLPDGIYSVRYTVAPLFGTDNAFIDQTFIKIDQIKCKYKNAFLKVDLGCSCVDEQKALKKELRNIDLLIAGAVAQANDCDPNMAYNLYKKADSMLDRISCNFGLPCSATWSCPQCNN